MTTSQANVRQLQFGIDAGSEPKWTDEGRPGNATLADVRLYRRALGAAEIGGLTAAASRSE